MDFRASLPKILDLLRDAVCVVDAQGRFVYLSAACERIFGYTQEELIGRNMIDLVLPEDRARTLAVAEKIMQGQEQNHFQNRYVRKDGRVVDIMWSATWSEADGLRLAVARDITELKRAERLRNALYEISEAAHAAEGLAPVLRHVHRIIAELLPADNFRVALYDETEDSLSYPYYVDEQHEQAPSPASLVPETLIGKVIMSRESLLGNRLASDPGAADWLGVPLLAQEQLMGALVVQSHSPTVRYTEEDRELLQFVSTQIASAIQRRINEDRLRHRAHHDALTGLPNRTLFEDRLQTAIKRARRDREQLALLYMDVDDFKRINDTLGHRMGDLVLHEIARRLKHCVRDSDTLGRPGGDEFTALLVNIGEPDYADRVEQKIRTAFQAAFEIEGHVLHVSISVGKALYSEHGENMQQLLSHADADMYGRKRKEVATGLSKA